MRRGNVLWVLTSFLLFSAALRLGAPMLMARRLIADAPAVEADLHHEARSDDAETGPKAGRTVPQP